MREVSSERFEPNTVLWAFQIIQPSSYGRPAYQMRTLYFRCMVSSSFFFLFSWPNLSRRRLDVYHTSTHDVALARI